MRFTQAALSFIKTNKDQPFFLYWPTTIPHAGMDVPNDDPSLADYRQAFGKEKPFRGKGQYVAQSTGVKLLSGTYAAIAFCRFQ